MRSQKREKGADHDYFTIDTSIYFRIKPRAAKLVADDRLAKLAYVAGMDRKALWQIEKGGEREDGGKNDGDDMP